MISKIFPLEINMSSTTEEKTLDDMQTIFEHANKINADIYTYMKKILEEKEPCELDKFKASLDNWLAKYASENNLTNTVVERLEKDKEIYDKLGNALKEYLAVCSNDLYKFGYDKLYNAWKENKFILLLNMEYVDPIIYLFMSGGEFEKLYDLVKYMKLEHTKTENSIKFPGVHFSSYSNWTYPCQLRS